MIHEIYKAIMDGGMFDGLYYEKFLNNPILLHNNKEIVRLLIIDDKIWVHLLDEDESTEFVPFTTLSDYVQKDVYADIFHYKVYDVEQFFDFVRGFLDNGDKVVTKYETTEDGEEDYEYLVYTIMNSGDNVLYEYSTRTQIFKAY